MNNTKVITFNVRCAGPWDLSPNSWEERLPRIQQFLNEERPVLFGVQEASHAQMVGLLDGTAYRFVGGGRDDFHRKGEYTGIFYDPLRLEVLDWGNFSLNDNPAVAGVCAWGAACPRMVTWGFFRELAWKATMLMCHSCLWEISMLRQTALFGRLPAQSWRMPAALPWERAPARRMRLTTTGGKVQR